MGPAFAERTPRKPLGGCFFVQCSMELSRPVIVERHGHLPICLIWVMLAQ